MGQTLGFFFGIDFQDPAWLRYGANLPFSPQLHHLEFSEILSSHKLEKLQLFLPTIVLGNYQPTPAQWSSFQLSGKSFYFAFLFLLLSSLPNVKTFRSPSDGNHLGRYFYISQRRWVRRNLAFTAQWITLP